MEEIQAEFPILQRKRYLNTCSLGALSQRSIDAVSEFLRLCTRRRLSGDGATPHRREGARRRFSGDGRAEVAARRTGDRVSLCV